MPGNASTKQCVLLVDGSANHHCNGHYAQLHGEVGGRPAYRQVLDSGAWQEVFLFFNGDRVGWCFRDSLEIGGLGSYAKAMHGEAAVTPCDVAEWQTKRRVSGVEGEGKKQWITDPIRVVEGRHADISIHARRASKAAWKEKLTATPWRCTANGCPNQCQQPAAREWGLWSKEALFGHLNYYHRESNQYNTLHRELWREDVFKAEVEAPVPREEIIHRFRTSMLAHGYDVKKLDGHVNRLLYVVAKLGKELSLELASAVDIFPAIEEWPEEQSSHGHYSVSFRWFMKFVENAAVDATARFAATYDEDMLSCMATKPDITKAGGRPHKRRRHRVGDEALPVSAPTGVSALDAEPEGDASLARVPPCAAPASIQRVDEAMPASAPVGVGTLDGEPERVASPAPTPPCAAPVAFQRIDEVLPASAPIVVDAPPNAEPKHAASPARIPPCVGPVSIQRIAAAEDPFLAALTAAAQQDHVPKPRGGRGADPGGDATTGSARRSEDGAPVVSEIARDLAAILGGDRAAAANIARREELGPLSGILEGAQMGKASEEVVERVWLWAYTGMGATARGTVLAALVSVVLERTGGGALGRILVRLLCVARSPHAPPTDVLEAMGPLLRSPLHSGELLQFGPLVKLAKKSFQLPGYGRWLAALQDEKWPVLLRLATFGALLADVLCGDVAFLGGRTKMLAPLLTAFQNGDGGREGDLSLAAWCNHAVFLSGLLWCSDATGAATMLLPVAACIPRKLRQDFENLQQHAAQQGHPSERSQHLPQQPPTLRSEASAASPPCSVSSTLPTPASVLQRIDVAATVCAVASPLRPAELIATAAIGTATASKEPDRGNTGEAAPPPSAEDIRRAATQPASVLRPPQAAAPASLARPQPPQRETLTAVAPASAGEAPGIVLARDVSKSTNLASALEGVVISRVDYRQGAPPLGFHVRLRDSSGQIDAKFFRGAADAFRDHPALRQGARVRLEGLSVGDADAKFAPPGRRFEIRFNERDLGSMRVLALGSAVAPQVLSLRDLAGANATACVDVVAWVLVAGEREQKYTDRLGHSLPFRLFWLTAGLQPDAMRCKWTLWDADVDKHSRATLVPNCKVRIRGARVKDFGGERFLTGAAHVEVL